MSSFDLVDACNITTGRLDSHQSVEDGDFPFFTCSKESDKIDHFAFDADAILVAGNNAQGNFHVNRYCGKFNAYQRTYVLTAKPEYDIDYIYYALRLELKRLKDRSQGSQTKFLTKPILNSIAVRELSETDQKRVSRTLKVIDSKLAVNKKINTELEAMAKLVYDYWFVQFDFPDENGKPYKSSGGKMVWCDQLKREIPAGWEATSLWEIAKYFNGLAMQKHRPTGDNFLPVIKIREMGEGFNKGTEKAKPDLPPAAIVDNGDILFSWSATLDVMIWSGGRGALNQHIFKVTPLGHPKSWVYFQLRNYLSHFKMMAERRKTTMGHITQDHLKQSRVISAPPEQVEKFDKLVSPMIEQQVQLKEQNQELANLRDWLLPMLMNGQVTVGD